MKQAYKKRSLRATANSPPMYCRIWGKLFYKSGKFYERLSLNMKIINSTSTMLFTC